MNDFYVATAEKRLNVATSTVNKSIALIDYFAGTMCGAAQCKCVMFYDTTCIPTGAEYLSFCEKKGEKRCPELLADFANKLTFADCKARKLEAVLTNPAIARF